MARSEPGSRLPGRRRLGRSPNVIFHNEIGSCPGAEDLWAHDLLLEPATLAPGDAVPAPFSRWKPGLLAGIGLLAAVQATAWAQDSTVVGRTTIKALAGRALRAPSAYELYYHDGSVSQKPTGKLTPERLNSLELIGEQQIGRRARFTVTAYRIRFDNAIALASDTADALLVYQNIGAANGRGFEMEAAGSVGAAIDLQAGVRF